ncbi:hypothetical protein JQC91_16190 [Jannaschia sp. Os4]|uniref:hypothetical protein n=1 Tax=Jannaschia sp. Os4 TaxID=2807617 RepID=UPI00193A89DD|nr:hypothetical protein [Jannaschia sp. Os4]MBM2577848.1 hypothetical protein [Jannaschia sp. Os4]
MRDNPPMTEEEFARARPARRVAPDVAEADRLRRMADRLAADAEELRRAADRIDPRPSEHAAE